MKKGQVKKRCLKCGTVALYRPAVRRCRHQKFGPRSYWCYGKLEAVPVTPRVRRNDDVHVPVPAGKGIGWVLSEEAAVMRDTANGARMRSDAQKKMDDANEKIVDKQRQVARLTRQISELQRKSRHYAKRAMMSDAEIAAEREKRIAQQARRAKPVRRGIKLGGA